MNSKSPHREPRAKRVPDLPERPRHKPQGLPRKSAVAAESPASQGVADSDDPRAVDPARLENDDVERGSTADAARTGRDIERE
jgi:hypothetical protein